MSRRLRASRHVPVIVIVTARDQHAIEAFQSGAVDYLLKPVTQDRLAQAVERRQRDEDVVPHAVHVDDDAVRMFFEDGSAEVRNHDRAGL